MRGGAVAIVATLALVSGCGLEISGLGAAADGDAGTTKPPPPDATVPATTGGDASSLPDDAGASSADAPTTNDATTTTDAGTDAADAACPPPSTDASLSIATQIAPPPVIDGNLTDWGCGPWIDLNDTNAATVLQNGQTISGQYAVRWDPMNVYVAAHIVVPTLMGTNAADPYENDAIEIYITGDSAPTGDYDRSSHQYVVDWHDDVVDYGPLEYPPNQADTSPKNFTSQVKVVPGGWQVEAAIGWQALVNGKAPTAGATIAFDVAFDDGNGTALLTQLMAIVAPHSISCGCQSCCCGEVSPDPDAPNCDTLCFGSLTLQ
jgi:hypothetical protein